MKNLFKLILSLSLKKQTALVRNKVTRFEECVWEVIKIKVYQGIQLIFATIYESHYTFWYYLQVLLYYFASFQLLAFSTILLVKSFQFQLNKLFPNELELQNSQVDDNTCMNLSNNRHSFHAIGLLEIRSRTSSLFQQLIVDSSPTENQ